MYSLPYLQGFRFEVWNKIGRRFNCSDRIVAIPPELNSYNLHLITELHLLSSLYLLSKSSWTIQTGTANSTSLSATSLGDKQSRWVPSHCRWPLARQAKKACPWIRGCLAQLWVTAQLHTCKKFPEILWKKWKSNDWRFYTKSGIFS